MEMAAAWLDKAHLTGSSRTPPGALDRTSLEVLSKHEQYGEHGQVTGVIVFTSVSWH
jgi:hypothetical protein